MPQNAEVKVVISSCVEYLDALHAVADEMAKLAGLKADERFNFALAVREAATNAVMHGNGQDPTKEVTVTFSLEKSALGAAILDQGTGFEFKRTADPRLPENLYKPSGRGMLLIENFVDEVTYNYEPARGTEVRLIKNLGG